MKTINKAVFCCCLRFRQWKKDRTVILLFFSVLILLFYYTRDIYSFSKLIREPISIWIFTSIYSDYIVSMGLLKVLLYFGVLLLFCNAPFIDKLYVSVVLRSGRVAWGLGQTLYIVFASFLYTIFVFISSIAVILPRVTVQLQWGKVIGTLALTDAAYQVPLLIFPWKVISNYNPLEATIWAMLLVWLTNTLIGLLLFCFNSIFSRRIGVCVCCGLILIDPVINMTEKTELLRFSPISWSSIENLATNKMSSMLEPMEATVVLLIICTILACVTIGYHRRKPLEKIGIKE